MTDILSATATGQQTSGANTANVQTTTPESAFGDFETFLTLLTAQMKYQDPLEPVSQTEFVAQLATFSSVEQQVKTNEKLDALVESLTASDLAEAASLIGLEIEVEGGSQLYGGQPLSFNSKGNGNAESATAVITDALGQEVTRFAINTAAESFTWDGSTAEGSEAEAGRYSASILYGKDGETFASENAGAFLQITEVRPGKNATEVVVTDGTAMDAGAIDALRFPGLS